MTYLKKYKNFPQALKDKVDEIRKEQKKINDAYTNEKTLAGLFKWSNTKEGDEYWRKLYLSDDFSDFEKKEKLKDKVTQSISKKGKPYITEVEDMYGSTYSINDNVKLVDKTNNPVFKNKTYFKILGFRWTNDNSKICAIINSNFPNGIGLDKIEHYVQPKKEPEFVLPKKWRVKRNPDNYNIINKWCNQNPIKGYRKFVNYTSRMGYIHSEKPLGSSYSFNRVCINTVDNSFTEITFEQFEQYVLHNGFKVGDKIFNRRCTIYDLKYFDGYSVAFYLRKDGTTDVHCRILTKNIVR